MLKLAPSYVVFSFNFLVCFSFFFLFQMKLLNRDLKQSLRILTMHIFLVLFVSFIFNNGTPLISFLHHSYSNFFPKHFFSSVMLVVGNCIVSHLLIACGDECLPRVHTRANTNTNKSNVRRMKNLWSLSNSLLGICLNSYLFSIIKTYKKKSKQNNMFCIIYNNIINRENAYGQEMNNTHSRRFAVYFFFFDIFLNRHANTRSLNQNKMRKEKSCVCAIQFRWFEWKNTLFLMCFP